MSLNKKLKIEFLIIGGSGAYRIDKSVWGEELFSLKIKTPFGSSNPVHIFRKDAIVYGLISRHGEKAYEKSAPFVNYRANIFACKKLGVQRILTWSGPGSISKKLKPGMLFVPDDILDFTKHRIQTFYEKKGLGFIRQNPVFCPEIRQALLEIVKREKIPVLERGVYVCTEGPRLETPAEIRSFAKLGGDAVGMTLVPEVFLARELEICYHPLCYITNYAEGVKPLRFRSGKLFEGTLPESESKGVESIFRKLPSILFAVIKSISGKERRCPCSVAMLRYRREGRISDDWRTWIE